MLDQLINDTCVRDGNFDEDVYEYIHVQMVNRVFVDDSVLI